MNVRLKRARELAGYAVQLTKDEGLPTMLKRGAGFVKRRCFGKRARYLPAKKVLEAQRAEMADKTAADCGLPTISILTPLYNTPEKYLREFLDSFVNQTAPNGQLCLADASDAEHADVKRIVEEYQTKYQRIVYKKIENKGIAANTNAAAELATGEYLALADHDDILAPQALYTMGKAILQLRAQGEPDGFLYSDEALFSKSIQRPMVAHFKPDYAPDYLLCCNYICHLAVFQKALWDEIGGERPECDGSQDHDLFLRLVEKTSGAAHVPQVLYYWRVHAGSTSGGTDAKPYVAAAAKKALADHLARTGRTGTVEDGLFPSTYRVKWDIVGDPKVSILIPNKDHTDDLEKCLHSIWTKTSWENFEVIVIENNSTDPATFTYYKEARQRYDGLQVVNYPQKGFNFSGINNFGRQYASGDYLLLLNNDVEVRNADWLTELLRQCARPGGAAICGAELFYPDETLQHAGVVTGLGGYAGHSHKYRKAGGSGYMFRAATVQDFSAVTGACLLVKTSVWDEVGGLDEAFAVAFNDVDFCLRVRDAGYRIAWTPYAQLTHYESKSRGGDEKDPVKARRFAAEQCSSGCTGLDALVIISRLAVLGIALTLDNRLLFHSAGRAAHDLGNGSGSLGAAGCALVAGHAVHDHSLCVVRTACVAAAAAVCTGKAVGNFFNAGVFLHRHELGRCDQNDRADCAHDGTQDNSRYNIHNPVPPLQRDIEQVFDDAAEAHEGQAGDCCCDQGDGQALEGCRGIAGFHALAHAAEHDHGQHEAAACADGTDQSLNVSNTEAHSSHICAVVAHDQNGDRQNTAVGGDQGQINAQRVIQCNHVLLEEDLDELHQNSNDQNEHDGLQVAQTSRVQNEDLDGEGNSRCHEHDEDDGAGHTNRRIQLFGNAQERADTVELHQHVVVDQDHAEEDRSEFY